MPSRPGSSPYWLWLNWLAINCRRRRAARCRCSSAARIVSGALCGAAVGLSAGSWIVGLIAGIVGAVAGTLGGHEARRRLAGMFGKDLPAALLEDVIAILAALWIVASLT